MTFPMQNQKRPVEDDLVEVCRRALRAVVIAPEVRIEKISVECLRSPQFDSFHEKVIFVVRVHTNDASMVRGDSNAYKGSYKERIEGLLQGHAEALVPDCLVHLEIEGPSTDSVERLIAIDELIGSGRLNDNSPIVKT